MCWEYIISLAIGVLSSLIATAIINKKSKKEKFNDEKQIFQRYIGNLRLELLIHTKNDNIDAIQRILENEPVLKTFNELSKNDIEIKRKIADIFAEIKQCCSERHISKDSAINWNSLLLKYQIDVLRFKRDKIFKKEKNKNG